MPSRRAPEMTNDPSWIRLQGRTNARLHLLARELDAQFVPPATVEAFAIVRGEISGCGFVLRVVKDTSDTARTGAIRHQLELDLREGTTSASRVLSGDGLAPPALDPSRVRSAVEANCYSFMSHTQT